MQCARYVPELVVTMGTYTVTDHFFVVNILVTNVVLGVQWLITLGKVTTDWEALEMEWDDKKTRKHQRYVGCTLTHPRLFQLIGWRQTSERET